MMKKTIPLIVQSLGWFGYTFLVVSKGGGSFSSAMIFLSSHQSSDDFKFG
jgi:hypothetical protein